MSLLPILSLRPITTPRSGAKDEESLRKATGLGLADKNLTAVPECIGLLTELRELYLQDNPISELPECITNLRRLEYMQIEGEGAITVRRAPVGITELPCWRNNFKDSDMSLSVAEALQSLELYKSYKSRDIVDISMIIGRLVECHRVDFSYNKILMLPTTIGMLTKMRALDVSFNQLNNLPVEMSQMTNMYELNVAGNMLTSFPIAALQGLPLRIIDIAGNPIIQLPESITSMTLIEKLVVADSKGQINLTAVPAKMTQMACWGLNPELRGLALLTQGPATPMSPSSANAPVSAANYSPASTASTTSISGIDLPPELVPFVLPDPVLLDEGSKLGEGGQGIVYQGTYQEKPVAIKVIKPDTEDMIVLANEVTSLKRAEHPNIVKVLGITISASGVSIVMELASGSLKGLLEKNGPLSNAEIISYGKQVADALNHCVNLTTSTPIHHRDLKSENVLIVGNQMKLTDFGLAQERTRGGFSTQLIRTKEGGFEQDGTIQWQGPEIFNVAAKSASEEENVGHRGEKSDVFSYGLLIWSMVTSLYPFAGRTIGQITADLLHGQRPAIPADTHPTIAHLIRACWRQNYKLRPRFSEIAALLGACQVQGLDGVTKETVHSIIPVRYAPIFDMATGELLQYLFEQGIPNSILTPLRQKGVNGELFVSATPQDFSQKYLVPEELVPRFIELQSDPNATPALPPHLLRMANRMSSTRSSSSMPHMSAQSAGQKSAMSSSFRGTYGQPSKPVAQMSATELVSFLNDRVDLSPSFVKSIKENGITGDELLSMTAEDLCVEPFGLSEAQVTSTLRAISNLRLL
eukprot:TRINITY_DN2272_c0_g3_i2.p1 TRINITY_DN2272_c0_g3~~TRINITY_DN2272_c0_g3_i2.p1  ORF type:complete len:811 (+),score=178.63 TRINITY_DN2272_c0_g3_i2:55-2487(+)